ncbi:hypothetical protein [Geomonas propionica]|uniref:Uncharacterized protein n=1 Tax=Geomonas propionica TaxID=2798582 RepID=A0ABS0YQC7_9BACT|nr:hypothetical protein [Geomonas propionica]MBJ6800157.1 hypothetical protein [Geomonas propionica]
MLVEHTLHAPKRRNIEIPYAGDRNKCPFCGSYGFTPGTRCRCGIWNPSENSYKRPRPTKRRKLPPSTLDIYKPQFDGLADRDPHRDHDELAPYRAQLDAIHDPAADIDSVPWEE